MSDEDGKVDWTKLSNSIDVDKLKEKINNMGSNSLGASNLYNSIQSTSKENMENLVIHNPTYDLIEIQEESNKLLGKIVDNTSVLKELVEINRQTQLDTEELKDVLGAIYEVSKAKNKNEADNIFKKALNAINTSGETIDNIARLVNLLMGIYNTVNLIN